MAGVNRTLEEHSVPPFPAGVEPDGLMKGFVDLVFRYGERFYIADYKSNHLGTGFEHYRQEQLKEAMLDHRYDLQYLIYTIALNRYLERRLRKYEYTTHFGGVYYLFLRGISPEAEKGNGVFFSRPEKELIETLDRYFKGEIQG